MNTKQINEKDKNSKSLLARSAVVFHLPSVAKYLGRDLIDSRPRMCKVSAENVKEKSLICYGMKGVWGGKGKSTKKEALSRKKSLVRHRRVNIYDHRVND